MGGVGGSYALTNGMNSRSSPKRMMMNITEWTLMSLLSAQMVEVIANFAFILGTKFKARLIDVFYILIELTVDQNADVIVRQASASTLRRIAIYLEYDDVYSMLKDNLDYVVDNTCVQLRNSVTLSYMHTHSSRYNYRSALVVDAVFGAFGCSLFTSSNELNESKAQASFSMLKDMILDTLDNVDQLAATSNISQPCVLSLIRVMNVMVYHALEPHRFVGIADEEISEEWLRLKLPLRLHGVRVVVTKSSCLQHHHHHHHQQQQQQQQQQHHYHHRSRILSQKHHHHVTP